MIILRTMGTIHLRQAALPDVDFHDANEPTNEDFGAWPIGDGKRSCTTRVSLGTRRSRSAGTPPCGVDLARRWRPRPDGLTLRSGSGYIRNSIVSRSIPTYRKMGYPETPGINGQSGTPNPDTNTYRDWQNINAFAPRQATSNCPYSYGAGLANTSASAKGGLQQLTQGWRILQTGADLD